MYDESLAVSPSFLNVLAHPGVQERQQDLQHLPQLKNQQDLKRVNK
jgi:hypothetical protein